MFQLRYCVIFLVVALVAAFFGSGGIASRVEIAKVFYFVFAIIAIVTFVVSLAKKN